MCLYNIDEVLAFGNRPFQRLCYVSINFFYVFHQYFIFFFFTSYQLLHIVCCACGKYWYVCNLDLYMWHFYEFITSAHQFTEKWVAWTLALTTKLVFHPIVVGVIYHVHCYCCLWLILLFSFQRFFSLYFFLSFFELIFFTLWILLLRWCTDKYKEDGI